MTTPPVGAPPTGVTKIVATIGPASATPDVIRELIKAGMNVARLNFSHGAHEQHARTVATIRGIAEDLRAPIAILGDLQGPRIRIGALPQAIQLNAGDIITLVPEDHHAGSEIPVTYDDMAHDVHVGGTILVDDGLIALEVTRVAAPKVEARVRFGGLLKSNKGMNLPGIDVSAPEGYEVSLDGVDYFRTVSIPAGAAADSAANYIGGWQAGSNGGTGFGPWDMEAKQFDGWYYAGAFLGNPAAAGCGAGGAACAMPWPRSDARARG